MPDRRRVQILVLTGLPEPVKAAIQTLYDVVDARDPAVRSALLAAGSNAQAVITNGGIGLTAAEIAALPDLKAILTIGVGAEAVDHEAAQLRGVPVISARGTVEDGVADHALALLLALARDIPAFDRATRGEGGQPARLPISLTGKRLGLIGLGEIGLRIAQRARAFGISVAYHNRSRRPDLAYAWKPDVRTLAAASDFLVVACPGGEATRHLVDAAVLRELGSGGLVVNIGRGSVIDTEALIDALDAGAIAGAALDVFEGEPRPSARLRSAPNLILTPHIAAQSPERVTALATHLVTHLHARLSAAAPVTPVPAGFVPSSFQSIPLSQGALP